MDWAPGSIMRWFFDSDYGLRDRLIPRLIFLRALGLIYFFRFLLARLSDTRTYRRRWNSPIERTPRCGDALVWRRTLMVRADPATGSRIYLAVLRAAGTAAGLGPSGRRRARYVRL